MDVCPSRGTYVSLAFHSDYNYLLVLSMATLLNYIAAILPRLLFVAHSIVALWLLVKFSQGQTIFWGFCVGLVCLFVESIYTILVRKGVVEYK